MLLYIYDKRPWLVDSRCNSTFAYLCWLAGSGSPGQLFTKIRLRHPMKEGWWAAAGYNTKLILIPSTLSTIHTTQTFSLQDVRYNMNRNNILNSFILDLMNIYCYNEWKYGYQEYAIFHWKNLKFFMALLPAERRA